jgi:anti-sigma-K factor RskA
MRACDIHASGAIESYFYGELAGAEQDRVERHIGACAECRAALEDLSAIRAALAARRPAVAPPGGDWSGFMARLDRETNPVRHVSGRSPWSRAGLMAMAAMLVLVTIGAVLAFRAGRPPDHAIETMARPAGEPAAPAAPADEAGFEALSEEHFERSKLVVLGLAAKDPAHVTSADWTYERELAATLLSDTRMYRMAAEERGLRSIADVMGDLELVLLQASFTDVRDPASLAQIQRLIRKRDLVEKMDVVAMSGL